jgi:hypothetical protein
VDSRISLDSIAYTLRRAESVDQTLANFPPLQSRSGLKGAIEFIHAHRDRIEGYRPDEERRREEARKLNPPELVRLLKRYVAYGEVAPHEGLLDA